MGSGKVQESQWVLKFSAPLLLMPSGRIEPESQSYTSFQALHRIRRCRRGRFNFECLPEDHDRGSAHNMHRERLRLE